MNLDALMSQYVVRPFGIAEGEARTDYQTHPDYSTMAPRHRSSGHLVLARLDGDDATQAPRHRSHASEAGEDASSALEVLPRHRATAVLHLV
jgi:hypothetical protein